MTDRPSSTLNSVLLQAAVWPSRGTVFTVQSLAASPGFPGHQTRFSEWKSEESQGNGTYPEQGVSPRSRCGCASLSDGTSRAQTRPTCAGLTPPPSSCNAVVWCFPREKFIIRTACLEAPRRETYVTLRRSADLHLSSANEKALFWEPCTSLLFCSSPTTSA